MLIQIFLYYIVKIMSTEFHFRLICIFIPFFGNEFNSEFDSKDSHITCWLGET